MAEAITRYRSKQGGIFETLDAAEKSERDHAEVDAIMAPLGPRPKLDDHPKVQFFQHDPKVALSVRVALVDYLRAGPLASWWKDQGWQEKPSAEFHPSGILGRICNDTWGAGCNAFRRFASIDSAGREWSQPYFAHNGPGDKCERVNP